MFSRKSVAWYLDKDGKYKLSPRDTPRYTFDNDKSVRGLLIEKASTNLAVNTPDKEPNE